MSNDIQSDHSELVKTRCKPSNVIRDQLNPSDCHLIHMIMGIAGEVGELLDAIKKSVIYRKELDLEHVIEELGDIEFYLEGFRQGLSLNRDDILAANIMKLTKRYSSGSYSDNEAKERADKSPDDFKTRMIEEKNQLVEKITKLKTFIGGDIFPNLPQSEKFDLESQLDLMVSYDIILSRRVERNNHE